ncbi:NHL repeat-containing protein [Marinagarivorans cellulosilyticus]|uniref:6-bladed beta-propeller n=1 Tax=Marinagarivorans cellulosilyticus TaxID=2721545 RepID=A0AAN1WGV1_9GAMM|nr:NHL repeat-containing protein [Marinagarivorans cellulosilyticus]BCD97333.1 hypothetical protein MARGE09_P1534 [Marinagarivorans cellulosilyticus]
MKKSLRSISTVFVAAILIISQAVQACPVVGAADLANMTFPKTQYPFIESGSQANQFSYIEPLGAAVSDSARVYILDSISSKVRISNLEGKELKNFGKVGKDAGMFVAPKGLAIDSKEDIYIADSGNHRIQRFNKNGRYINQWGGYGYGQGELINPTGIAVDAQFVYVADTGNNRIVVYNKDGKFIRAFGEYGAGDKQFNQPVGLATDGYGSLYIADSQNDKIKKFSRDGKFYNTWGARGALPGQLSTPFGLAYAQGLLYVAELGNHRIQTFRAGGKFEAVFGDTPKPRNPLDIRLHYPASIAVSPNGKYKVGCQPLLLRCQSYALDASIYASTMEDSARWEQGVTRHQYGSGIAVDGNMLAVLYPEEHSVLLLDASTNQPRLVAVVGGFGSTAGKFKNPSGVAIDGAKNLLYVSDAHNHRVQVFSLKKDSKNKLHSASFKLAYGQFGQNEGEFNEPSALVKRASGGVFVMDTLNSRVQVIDDNFEAMPKVTLVNDALNIFSSVEHFTVSQKAQEFFWLDTYRPKVVVSDNKSAVKRTLGERTTQDRQRKTQLDRLVFPAGIALDHQARVYVTDAVSQKIKQFDANGIYLKEWGGWGGKIEEFYKPKSIAIDSKRGRVFVIDFGNNRGQIFNYDGALLGAFGIGHAMDIPPQRFLGDIAEGQKPAPI